MGADVKRVEEFQNTLCDRITQLEEKLQEQNMEWEQVVVTLREHVTELQEKLEERDSEKEVEATLRGKICELEKKLEERDQERVEVEINLWHHIRDMKRDSTKTKAIFRAQIDELRSENKETKDYWKKIEEDFRGQIKQLEHRISEVDTLRCETGKQKKETVRESKWRPPSVTI